MLRKILLAVLSILIVGEGIYLARMLTELESLQTASSGIVPASVDQTESMRRSEKNQLPVTATGIEAEVKKRLSLWYKEPIDQVIENGEKKLAHNPNDVESHLQLAKIYVHFPDKRKEALKHFQDTLALEPNHPEKNYIEFWSSALQPQENSNLAARPVAVQHSKFNDRSPVKPGRTVKEIMDDIKEGRSNQIILVKDTAQTSPKEGQTVVKPVDTEIPTKRQAQPNEKRN